MCKNRDILHIGVVFGSTSDLYFVNHHFEDILHFIHVGRITTVLSRSRVLYFIVLNFTLVAF